jgi:hypothetical protein
MLLQQIAKAITLNRQAWRTKKGPLSRQIMPGQRAFAVRTVRNQADQRP